MATSEMDADMNDVQVTAGVGPQGAENFQHHTLRLIYPAIDLLPDDEEPAIEMPKGIQHREEPEIDALGLSDGDLEYFVRYATTNGLRNHSAIHEREPELLEAHPHQLTLADSINRLSTFAGISELRAVSRCDDDIHTRFQLTTVYYTNSGIFREHVQQWHMNSVERGEMLRSFRSEEWVRLLSHLISGKTDRAWRSVIARMDEVYEEEWLDAQEGRWHYRWDQYGLRGAKRLLMDRLVELFDCGDEMPMTKVDEAEYLRDQGDIHVRLPCGHEMTSPENAISDMKALDAWRARCRPTCDVRILTKEDDKALPYFYDRIKCMRWCKGLRDWP